MSSASLCNWSPQLRIEYVFNPTDQKDVIMSAVAPVSRMPGLEMIRPTFFRTLHHSSRLTVFDVIAALGYERIEVTILLEKTVLEISKEMPSDLGVFGAEDDVVFQKV